MWAAAKVEADEKALAEAAALEQTAVNATSKAKQKRIETINKLGVEALRREASAQGFTKATGRSAWKQSSAAELRKFLLSKV